MTERIYNENAYCKEFSAAVLNCEAGKKHTYEVTLDRTAFYPEGGGQPADMGTLGGVNVLDVRDRGGEVIHITDAPLTVGDTVTGTLDWQRRFDHMQNHSGEHMVSGLIYQKYGFHNIGFHMGKDTITIDFDGEFPFEELSALEAAANQAVWDNSAVDITVYDQESAKTVAYRSKKELSGSIRVVTFPHVDVCACCGTHVARTGEVGLIKLLSIQKAKGGVRIEMLCGRRALAYVNGIFGQNHQVSVALSAKPMNTAAAVHRLKKVSEENEYRLNGLENDAFLRRGQELENAGNVLLFENPMNANSVRKLAVAVMEKCGGRCAVFAGEDGNGYSYAIGETGGDLRSFTKTMNQTLNGRGGGKPNFVQGSVFVSKREIEDFFAQ